MSRERAEDAELERERERERSTSRDSKGQEGKEREGEVASQLSFSPAHRLSVLHFST